LVFELRLSFLGLFLFVPRLEKPPLELAFRRGSESLQLHDSMEKVGTRSR
jgi:hypothetical protein